jgi:transcriptional regulator with XRE-family HTH domain
MPDRIKKLIFYKFNNNQKAFARHMGYPQSTVNGWCLGKRSPNAYALADICTEFNISAGWLLGLEEDDGRAEQFTRAYTEND